MSASMCCMAWNVMTGFPNCSRARANLTASSSAPWATPTPCAPTPVRELSSVFIATINPMPSRAIRFSFGMRQSSNISSVVADALMPIFFSFLPNVKPGVPFSTTKADAPRMPLLRSVMAMME